VSVTPDGIALGRAITLRKAEVETVTLQGSIAPPNGLGAHGRRPNSLVAGCTKTPTSRSAKPAPGGVRCSDGQQSTVGLNTALPCVRTASFPGIPAIQ